MFIKPDKPETKPEYLPCLNVDSLGGTTPVYPPDKVAVTKYQMERRIRDLSVEVRENKNGTCFVVVSDGIYNASITFDPHFVGDDKLDGIVIKLIRDYAQARYLNLDYRKTPNRETER